MSSAALEPLNFELDSPEVKKNPFPLLRRLREQDPVHYVEAMDCWLVSRYADIVELYTDSRLTGDRRKWEYYKQPKEGTFFRWIDDYGLMALDRKTHALQRKLIGSGLTPRGVRSMDQKIREVVDHFARPLHGRTGVVDVMKEFTTPIPIVVIGSITGVTAPGVDDTTFSELAQETIRGFFGFVSEEVQERSERNYLKLSAWVRETIRARREEPQDDLISYLVHTEEGEFRLDDEGIVATVSAMLGAGSETTSSGGVTAITTLLDHPETLERVRRDRSLIPQTVNEVLRFGFGGIAGTQRFPLEDFEFKGQKFRKGQLVMLSMGGASRDPEFYDDPDRFDIDRDPQGLMTFGLGSHYCLGANLARCELVNIVDAALDFLPPNARVMKDQIVTESLGLFDRNTNCPIDFGGEN
ncbi:MAG: cytochrome P450 [Deltaproteobacteria bacterium]|nr:cytochrome P450 [Deltaproteobacteria bacterium]MBW2723347.1 cytochrome P450 [Deltaproteobacteria bacterium]